MKSLTKTRRKQKTNMTQRRKNRKDYAKKIKNDSNFRKNQQDRRKQYYKKNKKSSVGYSLPFDLEFEFMGRPAYLMSLSEMLNAINIYIEGETAILVNIDDFLDNTEWYEEEDYLFFMEVLNQSQAFIDDGLQEQWEDLNLEENDSPAKDSIQRVASEHMKRMYRKR